MGVIIKSQYIDYDETHHFEEPPLRAEEHVVKRYKIKYSVPQMVRFGMLPYSALEEYEKQNANPNEAELQETAEAAVDAAVDTGAEAEVVEEAPKKRGTFWEEDDGDRELMSQADFEKFLKESGIDISNAATALF